MADTRAADIEREGMLSDMETLRAEIRELRAETRELRAEIARLQAWVAVDIRLVRHHGDVGGDCE